MLTSQDVAFINAVAPESRERIVSILSGLDATPSHAMATVPLRTRVLMSDMPLAVKAMVLKRLAAFLHAQDGCPTMVKITHWVTTLLSIPFGTVVRVNTLQPSPTELADRLKTLLDAKIYGHKEAKVRVVSNIIAARSTGRVDPMILCGPPGVGKTTLVREALSSTWGLPFVEIPIGGECDASLLKGSLNVYEGSAPGRIVQAMIDTHCMNPVFFMDEVDKIAGTPRGAELTAVLMQLTDRQQQTAFGDRYLGGCTVDVSQCQFVFACNDINAVDPILRNRLTIINVGGYTMEEKVRIGQEFIVPAEVSSRKLPYALRFEEAALRMVCQLTEDEPGLRRFREGVASTIQTVAVTKAIDGTCDVGEWLGCIQRMPAGDVVVTAPMVAHVLRAKHAIRSEALHAHATMYA